MFVQKNSFVQLVAPGVKTYVFKRNDSKIIYIQLQYHNFPTDIKHQVIYEAHLKINLEKPWYDNVHPSIRVLYLLMQCLVAGSAGAYPSCKV